MIRSIALLMIVPMPELRLLPLMPSWKPVMPALNWLLPLLKAFR